MGSLLQVVALSIPLSVVAAGMLAIVDLVMLRREVDVAKTRRSLLLKGSALAAIALSYGVVVLVDRVESVDALVFAPAFLVAMIVVVVVTLASVVALFVSFAWDVQLIRAWRAR